ncbi:Mrp/NBP35 family ATP-binding protein [Saccharopolyspora sp. NPDC050389]|uniref:Mrp/NBP35 family ATP-binding protein n=1 Tax=Saccharopolyspora sp. NPDC050389 TaxID=3155516 RepID=UPI0033E99B82
MLLKHGAKPRLDSGLVRTAVGAVEDPELHRGLAELGMLRDVNVDRRGRARIEIALTTSACPLRESLREAISTAATDAGATSVEVGFSTMSERERMELAGNIRGEKPRGLDERTRVYAVASGKGGVGKSSVTANLAVALARSGQRVGVLDADVWGYSIPHLFGVRRNPIALNGIMLPVEAHGVRLMSVGFFVDDAEPVVWRGPMLHKALEQFLVDVHWDDLDVLLLDLPPGTGDVALSLLELVPQAALLAVTTPQPAAQNVAARVGRMARDQRMPIAGVVENMSALVCGSCGAATPLFGAGGGQRLAEELGVSLLAQVPLDIAMREAGDAGIPVVARDPDAPSAVAMATLAAELPVVRRGLAGVPLPLSVV